MPVRGRPKAPVIVLQAVGPASAGPNCFWARRFRLKRDGSDWQRLGAFRRGGRPTRQQLDLLDMGDVDHGAIPPLDPTPHPEPLAGERLHVDARSFEGLAVLALDEDGEIGPPILGEVQIDAAFPSPTAATTPSTSW